MKMAIIGSGQSAYQAAIRFSQLGASVDVYTYPIVEFNRPSPFNGDGPYDFKVIEFPVQRVHKRFLASDEFIEKSRLIDLFRVVMRISSNGEDYQNLPENLLSDIQCGLESFRDYDLVIDATGRRPRPLGPGGTWALNERHWAKSCPNQIFYGQKFVPSKVIPEKSSTVLIVGSGFHAAHWLELLGKEENEHIKVKIVTRELSAFIENDQCLEIFAKEELNFRKKEQHFLDQIEEWKRAPRGERPLEPTRRIELYSGFNAVAVDKLDNHQELFVSIERPEFRGGDNISKTLGVDQIWVGTGFNDQSPEELFQIKVDEPGFYRMRPKSVDAISFELDQIEKDILTYFSRGSE